MAAVVAFLFLFPRVALLFARDPFFDELFTLWMSRQPLFDALAALRLDSGPPLYYVLARFDSVAALRWLSLVFAAIAFGAILLRRSLGVPRYIAATLLAVFPPAVLFSVDARAYALCAMFVTFGVLLLDADKPYHAAAAFVLAAYIHYYGVLFFPTLLLRGKRGVFAAAIAGLAYLPGFWLSAQQPEEATAWLTATHPLAPLMNFSFAGEYPASLFAAAPRLMTIAGIIVMVLAGMRSVRFLPMVLIPLGLAMLAPLSGRPVYFPMRFEAVLAPPLVLWLGHSLWMWRRPLRLILLAALVLLGSAMLVRGTMDHIRRPYDRYRHGILTALEVINLNEPVVASGYLYLHAAVTPHLSRTLVAFPADQAAHPGWRSRTTPDPRELPPGAFAWIGERGAPELAVLRRARKLQRVYENEHIVIVRALPQFQP